MKLMYLVVIIIKTSHDSFQTSVNYHNSDRGMLYRSKIRDNVDEISHTCHFGLGHATRGPHGHENGGLGAVGRDQGRFQ